jgi:hypothetical protein
VQEEAMEKDTQEYRRMSDGNIWVFIEGRGWTFLEVHRIERGAGARTATHR